MIQVLSVYASLNGQTEKVSQEIERACTDNGCSVTSVNVRKHEDILSLLDADITFIGSGVYTWLPGKQMLKWIERQLGHARSEGLILPGSPRLPGRFACVYCTYGGPHTGVAEAIPCLKYMGQLFDHLGITVAAEWSIPGAFIPKGMQEMNVKGRLGNIEDRPNADDLKSVYQRTAGLINALSPSMI